MDDAPWDPAWVFQESCVASPPTEIFPGWPGAEDIGPDAESRNLGQAQLTYHRMHTATLFRSVSFDKLQHLSMFPFPDSRQAPSPKFLLLQLCLSAVKLHRNTILCVDLSWVLLQKMATEKILDSPEFLSLRGLICLSLCGTSGQDSRL